MSSKPVFVLVPGNFLPPSYYANTAKLLESHGYQARIVTIPSTGSKVPLTSNEPDINAVREVLEEASSPGEDLIVVAHSYGSIPTCEAAKGFSKQERLQSGKPGGIKRLVFAAAWLLREGESPPVILGKYKVQAPWARFEGGNIFADDQMDVLYHDVPSEIAAPLVPVSTYSDMAAFATPLKNAAWRHIPTTYLLCEEDKCIPTHAQEGMVAETETAMKIIRLPSGHMVMLSMPGKFVDILRAEAA